MAANEPKAARPMAFLAAVAAFLAIALIAGCALEGQTRSPMPSDEPSVEPSAGDTAIPSGGDRQIYDGQLLGFTIADVEALALDLGLECTNEPIYDGFGYHCQTRTPEFDTRQWFMIVGHTFSGDEAYNLNIITSTRPPNEQASRDAVADIAETLMPWITDLGWYRSGDFHCGAGRQGAPAYDNFGPVYSICGSSSPDPGGDGMRSGADLDIATEP
ncbi:MAG TPA: hypothetical protein VEW95_09775 [Candidatus Limnocylindrales bacterium]|nr:hypothetical protein [Candidatus Limnocylindrales bacterium]